MNIVILHVCDKNIKDLWLQFDIPPRQSEPFA